MQRPLPRRLSPEHPTFSRERWNLMSEISKAFTLFRKVLVSIGIPTHSAELVCFPFWEDANDRRPL